MATAPSAPSVGTPPMLGGAPPVNDPFAAFNTPTTRSPSDTASAPFSAPMTGGAPADQPQTPNGINTGPTQNVFANPIDGFTPTTPTDANGMAPVQGYGAAPSFGGIAQNGLGGGGGYGNPHAPTDPTMNAFRRIKPATTGAGSAGMSGAQPMNPMEI